MPRLTWGTGLLFAGAMTATHAQDATDAASGVKFGGHYRNMAVASRTMLEPQERYGLDDSRLRLEWKGQLGPRVGIEVQYDNEILLGDYVRTRQFQVESELPRRTYWDLEGVYARSGPFVARHRLRRGVLTLSRGDTDLRIGRQRVAWGTGRFWSPLDLLNPVSPVALEPGEREGVDALLLEHKRSPVSKVSFVYAPLHSARGNVLAQWHANTAGIDYSITAGRVPAGQLLGLDVAGQWRGAGVRAEWTVTRERSGRTPQRILLGWDYAFANTLTVTAELHYDGTGTSDPARYDIAGVLSGRRQTVGRRYAGLYAGYEITPLLKLENWIARNLDDRSWYDSPRLTYSLRENVEAAVGLQLFGGGRATEFGRRPNVRFAYIQWFF